jgi:hypothetical protein
LYKVVAKIILALRELGGCTGLYGGYIESGVCSGVACDLSLTIPEGAL